MVMPIYDDNPFKLPHRPVVTWALIAVNFVVFFLELGTEDTQEMLNNFGLTPALLTGEVEIKGVLSPVLTLVTYMFLHADWGHIFGNMIFLWVFGDDIEEVLGRMRFLAFYLLCGIIGGLAFVVSDTHSQSPLIGASGAISGVVIAYVMLRPCAKITVLLGFIPLRISAYWVVGSFVLLQFISLEFSLEERSRLLVPCRRHDRRRRPVRLDAAARRHAVRMHPRTEGAGNDGQRPGALALTPNPARH